MMCGRRRAYYSMVLASQNLNCIPRSRVTPWKSDDNYNVENFMAAVMTLNENFVGGVISDHAIMMSRLRVYYQCVTQNGAKELWQFSGHQYTCCSIQDLFWMELQLYGEKKKDYSNQCGKYSASSFLLSQPHPSCPASSIFIRGSDETRLIVEPNEFCPVIVPKPFDYGKRSVSESHGERAQNRSIEGSSWHCSTGHCIML